MAFLTELAKHTAASKGMHVGKLLASWRRKVSLAVHVAHPDNILRCLSAAEKGVQAASSSVVMPSLALFTGAMGRNRPRASSSGA
jgi:predicted nucleotide-binding protein